MLLGQCPNSKEEEAGFALHSNLLGMGGTGTVVLIFHRHRTALSYGARILHQPPFSNTQLNGTKKTVPWINWNPTPHQWKGGQWFATHFKKGITWNPALKHLKGYCPVLNMSVTEIRGK